MSEGWQRVTRQEPCAICGKFDWCCRGERTHLCMRVESGKPCKNGGWFHAINDWKPRPVREWKPAPRPVTINAPALMTLFASQTLPEWISNLADGLGVTVASLMALNIAWAAPHQAWAFPMSNAFGQVIGIRLRDSTGHKWAVTGSRQGIFLPQMTNNKTAVICEGPTDTAAALSLGLNAIGRPSCIGQEEILLSTLTRRNVDRVVIVADTDAKQRPDGSAWNPGLDGAQRLAALLPVPHCVMALPAKDMREFYRNGGTLDLFNCLLKTQLWSQPKTNQ